MILGALITRISGVVTHTLMLTPSLYLTCLHRDAQCWPHNPHYRKDV